MRDMERIKPKYNVTLDNKQIVMIIVSSVVILVLVFVIGFVLGKNTGIREARQAPGTAKESASQNAVVFTQQTMQSAGQITGGSQAQGTEQAAAETATETVTQTTRAEKHTELTFYKSLTEEGKHKEVKGKQAEKTEKHKAEKNKSIKKAIHKVEGRFSIQCGAFKDNDQAGRLSSELKKKYRLTAWIEPMEINGEKIYRVKIGHFETREKAQAYEKRQLSPKGLRNCVITVGK